MSQSNPLLDSITSMEWHIHRCNNIILKAEGERNAYRSALSTMQHFLSEQESDVRVKAENKKRAAQKKAEAADEALKAKAIENTRKGNHTI